jgi:uncharacterized ion transporter superfamily protein YfcC
MKYNQKTMLHFTQNDGKKHSKAFEYLLGGIVILLLALGLIFMLYGLLMQGDVLNWEDAESQYFIVALIPLSFLGMLGFYLIIKGIYLYGQ